MNKLDEEPLETKLDELELQMRREINAFMDNEQETRRKAATSPPKWPVDKEVIP